MLLVLIVCIVFLIFVSWYILVEIIIGCLSAVMCVRNGRFVILFDGILKIGMLSSCRKSVFFFLNGVDMKIMFCLWYCLSSAKWFLCDSLRCLSILNWDLLLFVFVCWYFVIWVLVVISCFVRKVWNLIVLVLYLVVILISFRVMFG